MKRYIFAIQILIIFTFSNIAFCANHFVRPGPNGGNYGDEDGSDWNNAFAGLPTNLVRGDTYYVAGGTYLQSWDLDDVEDGTKVITIKKANATDNFGVAGWQASFDTDQAVVYNPDDTTYGAAVKMRRGYYTIDGVTGSGTSGYGIKLRYSNLSQTNNNILVRNNQVNNCIIKHVEFENPGSSYDFAQWGIHSINGNFANWTVQYCYAHDFQVFTKHDGGNGYTIEYCYFKDNWSSSQNHGELLSIVCSDGLIFRFNIVKNATNGTGGIIVLGNYTTYPCDVENVEIYGNVFFNGSRSGNALWGTGNSADPTGMVNWKIYNNTIVDNNNGKYFAGDDGVQRDSGTIIQNNLYYNTNAYISEAGLARITISHNYYNNCSNVPAQDNVVISTESTTVLFKDYSQKDFRLMKDSQAVDAGTELGDPYHIDMKGMLRPKGTKPDIGAYELLPGPKNLQITISSRHL